LIRGDPGFWVEAIFVLKYGNGLIVALGEAMICQPTLHFFVILAFEGVHISC